MYLSGYENVAGAPGNMAGFQLAGYPGFNIDPEILKNKKQAMSFNGMQAVGNAGAIDPTSFGFQNKLVS